MQKEGLLLVIANSDTAGTTPIPKNNEAKQQYELQPDHDNASSIEPSIQFSS